MTDIALPASASLGQQQFTNMLRSLHNIDGYQLPELTAQQQINFVQIPVRYFMQAGEQQQGAIWREIMKRQPAEQDCGGVSLDLLEALRDLEALVRSTGLHNSIEAAAARKLIAKVN
ncbi:MAG: hypothetical protein ACLGIM_11865, partial [Alphaproteobacteria bacterium]